MEIKLHSNATTTPKTRKYIQDSDKSDTVLSKELGVSVSTIRRWRNREEVQDKSHKPTTIKRTITPEQECLILFLRERMQLSLDELLDITNALVNQSASRAGLNRILKKNNTQRVKRPRSEELYNITIDCFKVPEELYTKGGYLLILIERVSSYISVAIIDEKESSLDGFLSYLTQDLPYSPKHISHCSHELSCELANRLMRNKKQVNQHSPFTLNRDDEINFSCDLSKILTGVMYDARLGLPAILLSFEDILNRKTLRARLKNISPIQYIRGLISDSL